MRLPTGAAQGLLAHLLPLAELSPAGQVLLRGAFTGTGKHGWEVAQYLSVEPAYSLVHDIIISIFLANVLDM